MIIRKSSLYIFSPVIYLLLLTRASLDPILKMTDFGGISFGALLNLAVIVFFFGGLLQSRGSIPASVLKLWAGFLVVGLISIVISKQESQICRCGVFMQSYSCSVKNSG